MKRDVAIRGIDEETFRKFRAKTIEERMRLGEAITFAMRRWLKEEREKEKTNPANLLRVKPFDWGKGTERTSKEIDEILYGKRK